MSGHEMSGHELLSSRIAFTAVPGAARRARHWIAAQLARTDPNSPLNPDVGPEVAQLVDAAQQSVAPLANAAAHLGTHLDISC